jgi:hypothetical protein
MFDVIQLAPEMGFTIVTEVRLASVFLLFVDKSIAVLFSFALGKWSRQAEKTRACSVAIISVPKFYKHPIPFMTSTS